jgi:F-type H+-transporting ATPase subunit a
MLLADAGTTNSLEEQLHHPTWPSSGGFLAVNVDTLRNTLILVALFLVVAVIFRMRYDARRPNKLQVFLEGLVDFVSNYLVKGTLGDKPITIAPMAITLFFFLLFANWLGLIPGFKSPTNDINTAAGLAIMSIFLLHFYSVKVRRPGGYVKHYFSVVTPSWRNPLGAVARILFAVLEFIQEVSRPITLTCRLYFNIFAGEFTLALFIYLLGFGAIIVGPIWIGFSLFIGAIQAFIFTMLTIAYIHMGTEVHDDHADEQHGGAAHADSAGSMHIGSTREPAAA